MLKYLRIAAVLAVALDFICPSHGFLTGNSEAGAIVPGNVVMSTPPNPSTTTSTTPVMVGLGYAGEFTPRGDGIALITIVGSASDGTISAGGLFSIAYGQGAAPINAGTYTGQSCGAAIKTGNGSLTANVANVIPFTVTCVATGMQLGAPYWIDLAYSVTAASTLTLTNVTVIAAEQ